MVKLALMFLTASHVFNIPPGLLSSVCWVESKHNTSAYLVNDGGSASHGVCQVKEETARFLGFSGNEKELRNPRTNIYYAAKYIRWQLDRYDGNVPMAISAYNAGSCRKNSEGLIYNRKYVRLVFEAWLASK